MRVFQGIIEIAGQMGILCGALKKQGHIAVGYNVFHSYLGYQEHLINTNIYEIRQQFKQIAAFFDIFHYHFSNPIWRSAKDLELLNHKGKKIFMHHWGNDVRFHDLAPLNNPYVYTGDSPPDEVIHSRLTTISQYIPEAIVQDYEVLPYVEPYYQKVHLLPLAIDLRYFSPVYPDKNKKRPLILHAPTNPDFKGTVFIEEALAQLQDLYPFDYKRIEKMSHNHVIELYQKADIIIDQILCGSYGLLSVEAMALGKPVMVFIRPDLIDKFPPHLPVVNSSPENIKENLIALLENPSLRNTLGVKSRQYVEKHHCRDVVVEKLLTIYQQ